MMKTFCCRNWKEFVSVTTSWKWSIIFFPCKIQLLSKTFLSPLNLICLELNMFVQFFDLFRLLCNHKGVASSSGFLIISVLLLMILITRHVSHFKLFGSCLFSHVPASITQNFDIISHISFQKHWQSPFLIKVSFHRTTKVARLRIQESRRQRSHKLLWVRGHHWLPLTLFGSQQRQ